MAEFKKYLYAKKIIGTVVILIISVFVPYSIKGFNYIKGQQYDFYFCSHRESIALHMRNIFEEKLWDDDDFKYEVWDVFLKEMQLVFGQEKNTWWDYQYLLSNENKKTISGWTKDWASPTQVETLFKDKTGCESLIYSYEIKTKIFPFPQPKSKVDWREFSKKWTLKFNHLKQLLPDIKLQINRDKKILCQSAQKWVQTRDLYNYSQKKCQIKNQKCNESPFMNRLRGLEVAQLHLFQENRALYGVKWGKSRPAPPCISNVDFIDKTNVPLSNEPIKNPDFNSYSSCRNCE